MRKLGSDREISRPGSLASPGRPGVRVEVGLTPQCQSVLSRRGRWGPCPPHQQRPPVRDQEQTPIILGGYGFVDFGIRALIQALSSSLSLLCAWLCALRWLGRYVCWGGRCRGTTQTCQGISGPDLE